MEENMLNTYDIKILKVIFMFLLYIKYHTTPAFDEESVRFITAILGPKEVGTNESVKIIVNLFKIDVLKADFKVEKIIRKGKNYDYFLNKLVEKCGLDIDDINIYNAIIKSTLIITKYCKYIPL